MADESAFAKWAPVLTLCRDALGVLPRGWREKSVDIVSGGDFDCLHYCVTDGTLQYSVGFSAVMLSEEYYHLRLTVTHEFAKLIIWLEGRTLDR